MASFKSNVSLTTSPVRVLGAPHTGITIASLAEAEYVFHTLLNLPIQRHTHIVPPVAGVVGSPQADIQTAIMELPGGHLIELLEYSQPQSKIELKPQSWEVGSWHLALTVASIHETVGVLSRAVFEGRPLVWQMLSEPQELTAGPNAGTKICYMRDNHGTTLELFETAKNRQQVANED